MIRRVTEDDLPWIAGIWNSVIRETPHTFTTQEKSLTSLRNLLDAPCLVLDGGKGFATYAPFRSGPGYVHTMEHSIYLSAAARGTGLAVPLLNALEDHARAQGIHSFVAGIAGENFAAQRFHTRQGYALQATLPQVGWKFDRWHDLVLMQKFLS